MHSSESRSSSVVCDNVSNVLHNELKMAPATAVTCQEIADQSETVIVSRHTSSDDSKDEALEMTGHAKYKMGIPSMFNTEKNI